MSDGSVISILSDDDNDDIPTSPPLEYSVDQPFPPPFPNNTHQKSLFNFFTKKKGCERIFHKPNIVLPRSENGNGDKGNSKGKGGD